MRCFVSMKLPDNVRAHIFHSFEKLRNSKICFGNFVRKDNLHLTLKFLGDLSEDQIVQIKKVLEGIEFRQFPVETGRVGFFPNEKYVKVMWVELVGNDFPDLKREIDGKLSALGFNEKEKDFTSHITVARVKSIKDKDAFFEKVREVHPKKMFFIADNFTLMKSLLKKKGPEHKVLESFQMRMRA